MARPLPDIVAASADYERWLATQLPLPVNQEDLAAKHAAMAADVFSFLRATYYRWAQLWRVEGRPWATAPRLMSVGDLHLENFGTWRDAEGRLVWGINDFDECTVLPFTHDLIRLATSALLAIAADDLSVSPRRACEFLWEGYLEAVQAGGRPCILEEKHAWLHDLATDALRAPAAYWAKMGKWPDITAKTPAHVMKILQAALPSGTTDQRLIHRQSGLGSLGRPRFTAVCKWQGARIAREAKAIVTSGADWAAGRAGSQPHNIQVMLAHPKRASDPFNHVRGKWILRRLSPHCSRIELADLPDARDEEALLYAMGWETATMHLHSPALQKRLLQACRKLENPWLWEAAAAMKKVTQADWKLWRDKGRPR